MSTIDISSKCFMTKIVRWRGDSVSIAAPEPLADLPPRGPPLRRGLVGRREVGRALPVVLFPRGRLVEEQDDLRRFSRSLHQLMQMRVSQVSKVEPSRNSPRLWYARRKLSCAAQSASPASRRNR